MNEILSWALKYQKHGYSVIPVGLDKRPIIEWKKYQTEKASEEQIREWFDKANPPNIAIVTGKISGITVVDVENGGKWDQYPVTMTAKTGNGGYHLFYRYTGPIQNKARIFPLTDIRGDGGYVVASPSQTSYVVEGKPKGGKYDWIRKEQTQPFPYSLFDLTPEINRSDWTTMLQGVPQGSRNEDASKVIGKFLSVITPEEWMTTAWQMFVTWNQSNKPPLQERELRTIFNSIVGREVRTGKRISQKKDTSSVEVDDSPIRLISEIAKDITDDMTVSYPTGFKVIDESFMGGLKDGDLFFVTGATGFGKTTFAQTITYNLDQKGHPTTWFSFEVPIGEMWRKFKDMGVTENFQAYAPERIVSHNIEWIKKKIIEARDTFKTKIIFIDHLGFLAHEPKNYDANVSNNYSTILGMICRQLKTMALQEKVAIVLLGHVRKPASGQNTEPTINDIKDSAGIGQESDAVIILHRKRKGGYVSGDDDLYEAQTLVKIEKNRRTGKNKVFQVSFVDGKLTDSEKEFESLVNNLKRK